MSTLINRASSNKALFSLICAVSGFLLALGMGALFPELYSIFRIYHVPILICGVICGASFGAVCGALTAALVFLFAPGDSSLVLLLVELVVSGALVGYLHKVIRFSVFSSLLAAIVSGRLLYLLLAFLLGVYTPDLSTISQQLLGSLPSVITHILLCSVIIIPIKKNFGAEYASRSLPELYVSRIENGEASCIVTRGREVLWHELASGITGLLRCYTQKPELFKESVVYKKYLGKSDSIVFVLGEVSAVYGHIISKSAAEYLQQHNIKVKYGKMVDRITDQKGRVNFYDDTVEYITDPHAAYSILVEAILNRPLNKYY